MPKGIYKPSVTYRKTDKLKTSIPILQAHDPNFQMKASMTNEEIYEKLRDFGFKYGGGRWYKMSRLNGHTADEPDITIKPIDDGRLEMTLPDFRVSEVGEIIEAMHTLGFKVEVHITGRRNT